MPTRQQMEWMMRMGFIPPVGMQQMPQQFPAPLPQPIQMAPSPVQIGSSAADEAQAQATAQEQAGIGMVGDAMMMFGDPITKGAGLVIKGLSGLFGGGK